jgi:predicted RNA-binding Zn ribbon-like protein
MDQSPDLQAQSTLLWPFDRFADERVLCLDFVNTVSWRGKPDPSETMAHPASWIEWMRQHQALPVEAIAELKRRAEMWPTEAETAYIRAVEFRESLYRLLCDAVQGKNSMEKSAFDDVLEPALERVRIRFDSGRYHWNFEGTPVDWETALFPVALSAAQLLTSNWVEKLRTCGREECLWLFLDLTKNHSRKWCDMTTCGNVMKARRNYAKRKANPNARRVRSESHPR